jgi:hypothetical protein
MSKKNNNLLIVGAVGVAVYAYSAYANKGENEEDFLIGGGGSSNGVLDFLNEGGLTGNQIDYIQDQIEASEGETTIETFDFDGVRGNTIVTSRNNESLFTSDIDRLAGSNTFVAYTNDSGDIVGGSDFLNLQSVTADRAKATKKNFNTALSIASNNQRVINNASSNVSSNPISGGSSKKSANAFLSSLGVGSQKNYSSINDAPKSSSSSSGGSSKKSKLKTDSLSGKDKGKGSYTVTKKDGSKSKRYFQ